MTESTNTNRFKEGAEAFVAWHDHPAFCRFPENPYPIGTQDYDDWETGFYDASDYLMNRFFEDEE